MFPLIDQSLIYKLVKCAHVNINIQCWCGTAVFYGWLCHVLRINDPQIFFLLLRLGHVEYYVLYSTICMQRFSQQCPCCLENFVTLR